MFPSESSIYGFVLELLLEYIKSLSGETSLSESPKQKINSDEKCNKSDDIKSLNTNSIVPNQSLSNDDKTDQVDGDLYNFTSGKDVGNLSESDSNNSSRTNIFHHCLFFALDFHLDWFHHSVI
jgi:hypothetical protein